MKLFFILLTVGILGVAGLILAALFSLWWERRATRKLLRRLEGKEFPPRERGEK